ncbi:DNA double-strand break repair protein Mre11 [uncultured archaeon]|nr:DNA double-strand break repair protein Mre11 [uncultured archaeon]
MRVAFVSDTHFGYPRFEADASVQGRAAILDAASRADVLVLGGDIFDSRIPKLETILEVAVVLQEARKIMQAKAADGGSVGAEAPFPFILGIHGTHERRAKDALNPISMLAQMGLMEDLHNKTVVVESRGEKASAGGGGKTERLAFSGMGGIPDDLVHEALGRLSCKPEAGAVNFFIFHQTMREFIPVPLDSLASVEDLPPGYDWYLCGHIHARREMMGGKLLLPGSTVMTQMKDEEKNAKGYYVVDTQAAPESRSAFVPISTRPFEVSELKFEDAKPSAVRAEVEKELERLLAKAWKDKPILKIKLSGKLMGGAGDLDLAALENDSRAFVSVDNQLEGANLAAELEALKLERMGRATPLELGMAMLREQAGRAGIKPERAQELFEKYSKEE